MSLEEKIDKLTAALEANTTALGKIVGAAKGGATTTTAAAGGVKGTTTAKPKDKTDEEMRAAFGGYLSEGGDEGKAERREKIGSLLAHYEVKLVTELPKDKRVAALADLEKFKAGEAPEWAEAAGDDDDNMLG